MVVLQISNPPCVCCIPHAKAACRPSAVPFRSAPCKQSFRLQVFAMSSRAATLPAVFQRTAQTCGPVLAAALFSAAIFVTTASARMEGVNKPELLPQGEVTPVIDVAGFLTDGEKKRIRTEVESLERDKGIKLRVLAQNYPQTPGLAIKDYWGVDDNTVVFVADPNTGNILNFNVGSNIDLLVPSNFWSRLAGKYGSKFYWQEKGEGATIVNAVGAIDTCMREPPGRLQCSKIQGEFGEDKSSGGFGKFFFGS